MSILSWIAVFVVGAIVASMIAMQVALARRARALQDSPLPQLPGKLGEQIQQLPAALVYFFSPQCGACRAITPRVRALASHNRGVFAVDVMTEMELARALSVMATPTTVEIRDGKIAGYHIGQIPAAVLGRFGPAA